MEAPQLANPLERLRPVDAGSVNLLVRWTLDPVAQGPHKRVPDMTIGQLRDLFLQDRERQYFVVERAGDAKPLGRFYWREWRFSRLGGGIDWELNIFLADPTERGRGYGTSAQRLAAEHLVPRQDTRSVFAFTMADNHAERRALIKAGFREDGLMPNSRYPVALPPEPCVLFVWPAQRDRVFLEKPSRRRCDEFLKAVRRSRTLHGRWVSPPRTPSDFDAYLRRLRKQTHLSYWVRTERGDLAGVFNVSEIVRGVFHSGYLGFYAFDPHQGHGFMKQGLRAVVSDAFGPQRLHRLEANIQPGNEPSRRLVQSAAFRLEGLSPRYLRIAGRWRDHERWAITAEDWRARGRRGATPRRGDN